MGNGKSCKMPAYFFGKDNCAFLSGFGQDAGELSHRRSGRQGQDGREVQAAIAWATCRRQWSPLRCPKLSLYALKWSISIMMSDKRAPDRACLALSCAMTSSKRRAVKDSGQPVCYADGFKHAPGLVRCLFRKLAIRDIPSNGQDAGDGSFGIPFGGQLEVMVLFLSAGVWHDNINSRILPGHQDIGNPIQNALIFPFRERFLNGFTDYMRQWNN